MFRFLCGRQRAVVHYGDLSLTNSTTQLGFVQRTFYIVRLLSSSLHVERKSVEGKEIEQEKSVKVSYLMNSCGLSLESAISASKKVRFKNTAKRDTVLQLLRDHGFSKTQISKVVKVCPQVLVLDPDKTILPKIEFFHSIGFSRNDFVKIISSCPRLLTRSLQNHLTPCYKFLKGVPVPDETVVRTLKRTPRAFLQNFRSTLAPNLALLKAVGVPESRISFLAIHDLAAASCKHSKFCRIVNEVKEMGFNPFLTTFVLAIQVLCQVKKPTWDSKIEQYERWGWSKDEILAAFRRHPHCMLISKEKISRVMDFFVNKMGWLSHDIAKRSEILLFSLEKRTVPRCCVVRVLQSKGLIKENMSPISILQPTERDFVKRYVTRFHEKVPELLNLYQGKVELLDARPASQSLFSE